MRTRRTDAMSGAVGRDRRGSVLILMPVAVLIVIVLGAIATDFSVVLLAERQAADLADSLANDAAAATDEELFYREGRLEIDAELASAFVADAGPQRLDDSLVLTGLETSLPAPDTVRVEVRARVAMVFSGAVPGAPEVREVGAVSTAVAQQP